MASPFRPADAPSARRLLRRGTLVRLGAWAVAAAGATRAPALLAAAPAGAGFDGPLVLRTAGQSSSLVKYAPGDPQRQGLCLDIAAAVQRLDPQIRLDGLERLMPLRRLELMLGSDELDLFFCLLASERRREMMRFLPVPLYRVRHVLLVRAGQPAPQTWTALRAFARRRPLLLVQGSQLAVALQQADVAHQETARSESDAVQMLLHGRTDAVYGQDLALRHAMRAAGVDESRLQFGPQAFDEETQYAVVSRRLPEAAVERLTERLRQLQASGELARIVDRYR